MYFKGFFFEFQLINNENKKYFYDIMCINKRQKCRKKNLVEIINLGKKMLDNKNIIVNCCY